MDKRERYDPEDLESLLSERAFDELLAEERAYVLRHVSGRDEYEAMRATLGHMRAHPPGRTPITADPAVRDQVLAAFREAHRPQWRIWLNSISLWSMPERPVPLWRPALALASLALLIATGVLWFGRQDGLENAVAEVKTEVPGQTVPAPKAADRASVPISTEPSATRSEVKQPIPPAEVNTGSTQAQEDLSGTVAPATAKALEAPPSPEAAPQASAGFAQDKDSEKINSEAGQLADVQVVEISAVGKTATSDRVESRKRARATKNEKERMDDMTLATNADLFVLLKAAW